MKKSTVKRFFAIFVFLLVSIPCWAEEPVPGYRYPVETDYKGAWSEFRKEIPVPFHVQADFDGNGIADNGWILIKTDNSGWGLFVFLGLKNGSFEIIKLEEDSEIKYLNTIGINIIQPGTYETALGKGYNLKYPPGEPEFLILKRPAINFFKYESANSFFYWVDEAHSFKRIWISD